MCPWVGWCPLALRPAPVVCTPVRRSTDSNFSGLPRSSISSLARLLKVQLNQQASSTYDEAHCHTQPETEGGCNYCTCCQISGPASVFRGMVDVSSEAVLEAASPEASWFLFVVALVSFSFCCSLEFLVFSSSFSCTSQERLVVIGFKVYLFVR